MKRMNKKGTVLDLIMIVVVLFVFIIMTIVGNLVLNDVNTDIQADDSFNSDTKETVTDLKESYPVFGDGLFLFIFVLMWIVTLALSFMIDTHPIFFVLSIIALIFIILVGAIISNSFESFTEDSDIAAVTVNYPKTVFVFDHLVEFLVGIGGTILLVLFFKLRSQG